MPVEIVLGALTADGRTDVPATRALIGEAGHTPITFHKAFDSTRSLQRSLESLIELGVIRVLTSGGAATAPEGAKMLKTLTAQSLGAVAILAGGGVRPSNVTKLIARTGVGEVHLRAQCEPPTGRHVADRWHPRVSNVAHLDPAHVSVLTEARP